MTDLLAEALELYGAGYCPIRARTDGSKAPVGVWEPYQSRRPSEAEVRDWFANGYAGIGVVMGAVSGNAELLEFEGRAVTEGVFAAWCSLMTASGYAGLMTRLLTGYLDGTPGGGLHIHYRVAGRDIPGNTKLARRPATEAELIESPDDRVKVLIETRGKGGFVVTAPSNGSTHPSGRPWVRKAGGPRATPVVTAAEHAALMVVCRAFDRMPKGGPSEARGDRPVAPGRPSGLFQDPGAGDGRPGDDYNARTTWPELLEPHGWRQVYRSGDTTYWRRPGKSLGLSATTGYGDGDYLYVFSTSTLFESERSYDRFGAYALLEHGGNHAAAARHLLATTVPAAGAGTEETSSGRRLVLTAASDIRTRKVTWLWDGRLALGILALMAGREGLGKSSFCYWLAACVTRGLLPGEYHGQPRAVLVCATEDSWEHTIVPRLIATGADLGKVYRVEVEHEDIVTGLTLPRDNAEVEAIAHRVDAALLLLDPIMSRISVELNTNIDPEVRRALEPMTASADRAGLTVLGIIHLNKTASVDILDRVMGSKAFAAVARAVCAVVPDPDDSTHRTRLFGVPKNNLGRDDLPSIRFTIEGTLIHTDDGGLSEVGRVVLGQETETTIKEAMERNSEDDDTRTQIGEAKAWLLEYLTEHDHSLSADIKQAAATAGVSVKALDRARKALGVVSVNLSVAPRRTTWSLPVRPSRARGEMG